MNIAAMTFRFRVSWVHSLKEKRMIVNCEAEILEEIREIR